MIAFRFQLAIRVDLELKGVAFDVIRPGEGQVSKVPYDTLQYPVVRH